MNYRDLIKQLSKIFQRKTRNSVTLNIDEPLTESKKNLKVGDKNTPIEISEDTVNIAGSLKVNGADVQTGTDAGATQLNELSDVTYSSGDLTITSLDKIVSGSLVIDSSDDITLEADDNITLDATDFLSFDSDGRYIAKVDGTEFSATNSAYAGMILGYTCISATYTVHYLETSFTVEDAGHKVTFTAPPSGNVEIEFTGFFDRTSTSDVTVYAGLSDNATYNSVGNTHEYDYNGVKSDDEIDDEIITFKWCVSGLTAGASITYYLGLKSSDATAVHLKYGYRSTNGLAYHPFMMKATALPGTIYDGT